MLNISNLKTQYETADGTVHAVDGVDIDIDENQTIGLVGESGSGKTTLGKSIMRLLPENGNIVEGSIDFRGESILDLSKRELRELRWDDIAMIPQSAMNSLDPVYTVGEQIIEVIQAHNTTSRADARSIAVDGFESVGLDPDRLDDYQHQLSGGQQQRAMIALALVLDPSIVIADEPTTALDVITQNRVLHTLNDLQQEINTSIILITHDVSVASEICDKIGVMYGGRLVEFGDTETILSDARHPYTLGLQEAFPSITTDKQDLVSIPGEPPSQVDPDAECGFADRCPFAEERCFQSQPEAKTYDGGHQVECVRADEYEMMQQQSGQTDIWRDDDD
jgi:peptide/nickel transport system ATP-binding protein